MNIQKWILLVLIATFCGRDAIADTGHPQWMIRARAVTVVPQVHSSIKPVGGYANVTTTVIPELDFSFFFTPNIAAETIVGTNHHKITAKTPIGKIKAGSVWMLPFTLTLQYHFFLEDCIKPYVGVGPNFTVFYNKKAGDLQNVSYKNRFGIALQAGIDFPIEGNWYFNLDAKKIFLKTRAAFLNKTIIAHVRLDPWLFGAGLGYRF